MRVGKKLKLTLFFLFGGKNVKDGLCLLTPDRKQYLECRIKLDYVDWIFY